MTKSEVKALKTVCASICTRCEYDPAVKVGEEWEHAAAEIQGVGLPPEYCPSSPLWAFINDVHAEENENVNS